MKNSLLIILLLSVLLRAGVAVYLGNDLSDWRGGTADQVSYDALAQRVVGGYGFSFGEAWWPATAAGAPTAHWSYLYTGFLAAIYAGAGHLPLVARLIQAVVTGLLLPWLAYRIGRRTFGRAAGLAAAALLAGYAYFILYSAALMTEAFYTAALLWLVDAAQRLARRPDAPGRGGWARLGIELGLAAGAVILLRQVGLSIVAGTALWVALVAWRRRGLRPGLAALLLAGGVTLLLLLPWTLRNYRAFGIVTLWPNTNAGFALYWANHPIYGDRFETVLSPEHGVSYQELIPPALRGLNEMEMDRALRRLGGELILADPGRYLRLSLSRIPVHFQFWPTADSSASSNLLRVLSFGVTLPFILAGLALFVVRAGPRLRARGWWRRGEPWSRTDQQAAEGWLLFGIIVVYNLLHILTWAKIRYRLPTDAFMLVFAGAAIVWLWEKMGGRGRGRGGDGERGRWGEGETRRWGEGETRRWGEGERGETRRWGEGETRS